MDSSPTNKYHKVTQIGTPYRGIMYADYGLAQVWHWFDRAGRFLHRTIVDVPKKPLINSLHEEADLQPQKWGEVVYVDFNKGVK